MGVSNKVYEQYLLKSQGVKQECEEENFIRASCLKEKSLLENTVCFN